MGENRLPRLPQHTPQLAPASASSASGNGSRATLIPHPPRRSSSGGRTCEPAAAARQHGGGAGDTTRLRLEGSGKRGPRSRRAPETKAMAGWQPQGTSSDLSRRWTQGHGDGGPDGSTGAMPALEVKTVAELLRNRDTRDATLSALEEHGTPIDLAVSLTAAPVLTEIMASEINASDTSPIAREEWDRVCLLLARLVAEAGDDAATVYGTAYSGGRYATLIRSERALLARVVRKPAEQLTLEDARSVAWFLAAWAPGNVNSWTKLFAAQGCSVLEGLGQAMKLDPLISKCGSCFAATSATSSQTQADVLRCVGGAAGRTCLATMRMPGWLNCLSSCSAALGYQTYCSGVPGWR